MRQASFRGSLSRVSGCLQFQSLIKEGQTKRTGTGVGADDAADLAHQRLGTLQVVLQVGLDGLHLAGRQRITGQRRHGGADAAQLFYLFEQRT